jgi:hypothetical protein
MSRTLNVREVCFGELHPARDSGNWAHPSVSFLSVPNLFDLLVNQQVYLRYADAYLDPAQIDEVVLSEILGYTPPT